MADKVGISASHGLTSASAKDGLRPFSQERGLLSNAKKRMVFTTLNIINDLCVLPYALSSVPQHFHQFKLRPSPSALPVWYSAQDASIVADHIRAYEEEKCRALNECEMAYLRLFPLFAVPAFREVAIKQCPVEKYGSEGNPWVKKHFGPEAATGCIVGWQLPPATRRMPLLACLYDGLTLNAPTAAYLSSIGFFKGYLTLTDEYGHNVRRTRSAYRHWIPPINPPTAEEFESPDGHLSGSKGKVNHKTLAKRAQRASIEESITSDSSPATSSSNKSLRWSSSHATTSSLRSGATRKGKGGRKVKLPLKETSAFAIFVNQETAKKQLSPPCKRDGSKKRRAAKRHTPSRHHRGHTKESFMEVQSRLLAQKGQASTRKSSLSKAVLVSQKCLIEPCPTVINENIVNEDSLAEPRSDLLVEKTVKLVTSSISSENGCVDSDQMQSLHPGCSELVESALPSDHIPKDHQATKGGMRESVLSLPSGSGPGDTTFPVQDQSEGTDSDTAGATVARHQSSPSKPDQEPLSDDGLPALPQAPKVLSDLESPTLQPQIKSKTTRSEDDKDNSDYESSAGSSHSSLEASDYGSSEKSDYSSSEKSDCSSSEQSGLSSSEESGLSSSEKSDYSHSEETDHGSLSGSDMELDSSDGDGHTKVRPPTKAPNPLALEQSSSPNSQVDEARPALTYYWSQTSGSSCPRITLQQMREFDMSQLEDLFPSPCLREAGFLSELQGEDVRRLSKSAFTHFTCSDIKQLHSPQFLSNDQLINLGTAIDEGSTHPAQVLTPSHVASLPASVVGKLAKRFVRNIPPTSWSTLTKEQLSSFSPPALEGVSAECLSNVPPEALLGLTKEQIQLLGIDFPLHCASHPRHALTYSRVGSLRKETRDAAFEAWFNKSYSAVGVAIFGSSILGHLLGRLLF